MSVQNKKLAILQPQIPHYREEFFIELRKKVATDIFVVESPKEFIHKGFNLTTIPVKNLWNINIKGLLFYSPFPLLSSQYKTIVMMLHFAHITTWLLLLTKKIHRKKIVLWGQGISVKRYLKEERKPDWKLKLMIALSDGVWLYMEKEKEMWKQIFPKKNIVALNNTLSGVSKICNYTPLQDKKTIKKKYCINQEIILIFCARFESNYRRTDLLIETIKQLNTQKFAFIIIGEGKNKPNFSPYKNVYDFGAIYDSNIKQELFSIADIYFQPGWVGLSIVEAMAYGKPIFTFKRSMETKQCVEYSYIINGKNGIIFNDLQHCLGYINDMSIKEIERMGNTAKNYVKQNLLPEYMVQRAISIL